MIICHDDFLFDVSQSSRDRPYLNRILILTLIISCLLHFLALRAFPDWRLWKPVTSSIHPPLQISLQHVVAKTPSVTKLMEKEAVHLEAVHQRPQKSVEKIITKQEKTSTVTEIVTTQNNPAATAPKKIELLTREDLNDMVGDKKIDYPTDDNLAFNPRLKENRAVTRTLPKGGAQEYQLEAWQDIHGNRFYKSGGQCYKATSEAKGISSVEKGTNWYFVSCGGKSESEKITDRINQEMKQRFRK